ncbi:MAG: ABC transporter permease [Bergeyella sp.]|nr:ABC transporter permease [Bergeyella sp.]
MKFPIYFVLKIASFKGKKNSLSQIIVFIGRMSVALGITISLITVATGLGSKNAIKNSLGDFGGEIVIKSFRSNSSYDSSVLDTSSLGVKKIKEIPGVACVQKFITSNGIIRTEDSFSGIIFKGISEDFNRKRFSRFILEGEIPRFSENTLSNDILLSKKIATAINKKLNDSVVVLFSKEEKGKVLYRKFKISGIYKTDIKMIDDLYVLGDIKHARKILGLKNHEIGGIEIYLDEIGKVDTVYLKVQDYIGYKNYAQKISDLFPQILDWIEIFDTNITLIIGIMLLVVVINIVMVLLILIIERTHSIGVLKTLGATNKEIRKIFIGYTLVIMIPGLVIGNMVGLGLLIFQKFFGIIKLDPENYYVSVVPVDLDPFFIVLISFGMLFFSALALVLPSCLISKISPIKAIKYD